MRRWFIRKAGAVASIGMMLVLLPGFGAHAVLAADQPDNMYATYGTHNPPDDSRCANPDCIYVRGPSEPTYPAYWSSDWIMYRVFQGYAQNPPQPSERVARPPDPRHERRIFISSKRHLVPDGPVSAPDAKNTILARVFEQ